MFIHSITAIKNPYCLITSTLLTLCLSTQASQAKPANAIALENLKKGSTAWQHPDHVTRTIASKTPITSLATATCGTSSVDFPWANDNCIMGYTSAPSVNKGASIVFKVSVNPAPQTYNITFYRMGWYAGSGATQVAVSSTQSGITQPACAMQTQTGLTECNWSSSYTLNVPSTWTTGVYLAQLTNFSGWKSEIIFVVRDDNRAADFLYQLPMLTYLAYNNYPDGTSTGKSIYDASSSGSNTIVGTPRAAKVSFDRPLHHQFGSWLGTDWSEIHLVAWLEKMGYNINYTTDLDVHTSGPGYLQAYKGLIIGGHSEYWTKTMYDKIQQARDAGINLAFFGANANHWQVRMESSSSGIDGNRVLTCYKDENGSTFDPIKDSTTTKKWRDLGRAEQTLIGVQHDINGWNLDTANQPPLIVQTSSHWAYSGTNFANGSAIPYLIGYEIDNLDPGYPKPPLLQPTSQTIIGNSPFVNHSNTLYTSQASIYQAPSKAWVFGSGTMSWSWALSKQAGSGHVYQNAGIQQATKNILDTFKNAIVVPPTQNRPPLAVNDSATVNQGGSVTISVLSNDSDPDGNNVTISSVGAAAHGVATKSGSSILYTPTATYTGTDSFNYTINDGFNGTATATVTVTVKPVTSVNHAPTAVYDIVSVPSLRTNNIVAISPLKNDSDVDGNTLTVVSFTKPTRGSVTQSGNVLTFTATSSGQDSFYYTISDGFGGTATAPIWLTIGK